MKLSRVVILLSITTALACAAKDPVIAPSYAWQMLPPLGLHETATIDTTLYNYFQQSVPSEVSIAYATTGNLGAEGMNMIFFDRKPQSDFFFRDVLEAWLPERGNHKYYNTRIPMTLLSYNTGGGKESAQDRLQAVFSGNVNKQLQIGANLDYLYSKGSYQNQAVKDMAWGLSSSYMGDRFEYQAFFNHYNYVLKENGGLSDIRYVTEPGEIQGGVTSFNPKTIPVRLNDAHNRLTGQEAYINSRYKVGYWHTEPATHKTEADTVDIRTYIPVSSFIWTLDYNSARHVFDNKSTGEDSNLWENSYLTQGHTHDVTSYWSLRNTFGVSLLEGFHKYAKFGLAGYVTHEIRKYTQAPDTMTLHPDRPSDLTPYPYGELVPGKATENLLWVGAQLTKQRGTLLRYEATGKIGVVGAAAGEIHANGNISTRFKLLGDTVAITGYGLFANETAPYLMKHYVSNHFIWENDFGKIRRLRFGGKLDLPFSGTHINVGAENVQNMIYFNELSLPQQHSGSVQVFSASLQQDFRVGILNWRNRLTYQTSSNDAVLPLPKFAVYSNLYILFKVAGVLSVQLGVDCDYYTKYYAPGFQPATMTFYNQREVKLGNYPMMNAYANMKLSKARFYVLYSHVNQGLTGRDYFSVPGYPLNPRRLLLGISVDFAN
ncbi:MAG: putative porin [Muribaculaceae bacterium]|nr:putative porin [Muribaculaceae bacterium]